MFGANFILMLLMFGGAGGFINTMLTLYMYMYMYMYVYNVDGIHRIQNR